MGKVTHVAVSPRTRKRVYHGVTDALGRRVFTTTVQPANRSMHLTVPATITPGSYTLVVVSQAGRRTSRVTKE